MYNGTKHTLGANLKREGVEDRLLQKLFGHADLASVRRYAPIADSSLVEVVDLMAHQRAAPEESDPGSDSGTAPAKRS